MMLLASLLLISFTDLRGQQNDQIQGTVFELNDQGVKTPVFGANVVWLETSIGTVTDENGEFNLNTVDEVEQLVVSYVGCQSDTITVGESPLVIMLVASTTLDEVSVVYEQKGVAIDYLNTLKSENIHEKELLKAACCSLSESFDTNPSVDVSFTDAVTGTRQIQMLGLAGPYTQITSESMPSIRGLSAIYGMSYVPGTWIESIQLNKGTGSVVNGFESMAGQINVELRKPDEGDKFYFNLYGNEGGRLEANVHFRSQVNNKWSTATLLHSKYSQVERDRNDDGFMDMPLSKHFIGLNRWKYIGEGGLRFQVAVKGTYINSVGGQVGFDPEVSQSTTNLWGMHALTKRIEAWSKIGKVYEAKPWKSIGLQLSAVHHDQESFFGLRQYDATQQSFYGNFVYNTMISNTNHKIKTGLSVQYDRYDEILDIIDYVRDEFVPGSFIEYSYTYSDKFSLMAGLRLDHHNTYGAFVTPRFHARYEITEGSVARVTLGRGQRTANVLGENIGILASAREIVVEGDNSDSPYGLDAEVAWNYGVSFVKDFVLDYRDGTLSVEYYRTNFENQIVLDLDSNPQKAVFYNLKGDSYSNSFQVQVDYELVRKLDLRIGYRWFDVKTTYGDVLLTKPLVSTHRVFLNLGYETKNNWKFDYTVNWQGEKRIPNTSSNPLIYQLDESSPSFLMMNMQVTKGWETGLEVYLGVENALNYTQLNPIIASDDPFGDYFDSSLVWGPIFGRNTYIGLRYRL